MRCPAAHACNDATSEHWMGSVGLAIEQAILWPAAEYTLRVCMYVKRKRVGVGLGPFFNTHPRRTE
jgi:hypothetical protein